MEKLKIDPNRFKSKKSPNHHHNWELLAEEVSNYFGKPLYWLWHKYPDDKIMSIYKWCKEKGVARPEIIIALLNKK